MRVHIEDNFAAVRELLTDTMLLDDDRDRLSIQNGTTVGGLRYLRQRFRVPGFGFNDRTGFGRNSAVVRSGTRRYPAQLFFRDAFYLNILAVGREGVPFGRSHNWDERLIEENREGVIAASAEGGRKAWVRLARRTERRSRAIPLRRAA